MRMSEFVRLTVSEVVAMASMEEGVTSSTNAGSNWIRLLFIALVGLEVMVRAKVGVTTREATRRVEDVVVT